MLTGSEKQIAWATEIKSGMEKIAANGIPALEARRAKYAEKLASSPDYQVMIDDMDRYVAALRRLPEIMSAEWFIENRKWTIGTGNEAHLAMAIEKYFAN